MQYKFIQEGVDHIFKTQIFLSNFDTMFIILFVYCFKENNNNKKLFQIFSGF
jgi:hypothetical protein